VVDFPRFKPGTTEPIGQLAIRPLLQGEQLAASIAAEKAVSAELKDSPKDSTGREVAFSNASAVEIIFRACRDANDLNRPAFPSTKAIRDHLTTDECGVLFNQYLVVSNEVGPIISGMTIEERDAWLDKLEEAGSNLDFLASYSPVALRTFLSGALERVRNLRTLVTSVGSQPVASLSDRLSDTDESEGG